METVGVSGLLRPLAAVFIPIAKKWRAERRAGRNPFSIQSDQDPLDRQLEAALGRLGAINSNDNFWRNLLNSIGAAYTRPEFFEKPSTQDWLSNEQVKADFKALARARMAGLGIDPNALDRIRDTYSKETGEARFSATLAIAVVLAVLHASVYATLPPDAGTIVSLLKDASAASVQRDQEQSEVLKQVRENVARLTPAEDPLHGQVLRDELSRILNRRGIPGVDSSDDIEALVARLKNAEFALAPSADKAKVYYWAARILASEAAKAEQARTYLKQYQSLPSSESHEVAFINAWLKFSAGQVQDAIAILSTLDTADARTGLLAMISKRDGNTAALQWLDDYGPHGHTLLTPVGWRTAAILMAEEGKWEDAVNLLDTLPIDAKVSFPELFFVTGVLHASFLLPEPIRLRLLRESDINFATDTQAGEVASKHRKDALESFHRARELMLQLGAMKRARGCEYHLMWIRLTDPTLRQAALTELKTEMTSGEYAARMLAIALIFDDTFDREPLERYLRRRKREGRQAPEDHVATLRLLTHFGTPSDVLSYLEDEAATLAEVLTAETLAAIKLHALIDDGRISDAESELEQHATLFSPNDCDRYRLMFAERKGEELDQLESLYQRTGGFQDLQNLVRYLRGTRQWASLLPHARNLLSMHRTSGGVRTVVHAMQQAGAQSADIIACLDENHDLIVPGTSDGDDLLLSKGWALFNLGRYEEAKEIILDLVTRDHEPDAISLEMNLALRTGQWERFNTIIDREFPRCNELPSRLLLRMASVVADWDQDRAMALAGMAAEKDPNDGAIQANAYWLASQIGREIDATIWLERMMHLARQGEGPAQPITLREMAEMMPARAAQRRDWERQFSAGEIGVHGAAALLNIPMAQILVGEPLRNEREVDPRRRSVVPMRHGGRGLVDITGKRRLAFDLSTLLILEHLGILESTFNGLEKVYLSPRLMDVLFVEHRQVRFHQPSLVEEARRIRELIADNVIQLVRNAQPPAELVAEVGAEMASLLHLAQTTGGRVLSTLPVHKAGSLDLENADLGEYAPLVLKTTQFLPHIENQISPDSYARAQSFLRSVDRGPELGALSLGQGRLYIDDLALRYLNTAGVLQTLRHLSREIFVADSVNTDAKALIEAARHGNQVADVIDRLRKRIRDCIDAATVVFLPETDERENQEAFLRVYALQDVIATVGDADALCVDDRAIGKHTNATDRHGRTVPIAGSTDVLADLAARGVITASKKRTCDFRLQKGGFALLPLDADLVLAALKSSMDATQSRFNENRDLLAIRESIQRIRSIRLLKLPDEAAWFSQIARITHQSLFNIWDDVTINLKMSLRMSDWLVDALAPLPTDWRESIVLTNEMDIAELTKLIIAQLINTGVRLGDADRADAFANWADNRLIKPLLPTNSSLVDDVSKLFAANIATFAKSFTIEHD